MTGSDHTGARAEDLALRSLIERIVDERVEARVAGLTARVEEAIAGLRAADKERVERASIMVFSGDFDRLVSAFVLANGAAAMGLEVTMCFTFWGLVALKRRTSFAGKSLEQKLLAAMMPGSRDAAGTSRLHLLGLGPWMLRRMMAQRNVESLPGLVACAREQGVRLVACQMAMDVMGIRADELIEGVELGGAVAFLGDAIESKFTLFV